MRSALLVTSSCARTGCARSAGCCPPACRSWGATASRRLSPGWIVVEVVAIEFRHRTGTAEGTKEE